MKLSDKILTLRKQHNMSQEELAEKLDVSRQAISRWEAGAAQPDASNLLRLSRLFGVTADYLLNDDYGSDQDVPAIRDMKNAANEKVRKILALCVSAAALSGNFIIYILSRFTKVLIPHITYQNGKYLYRWSNNHTGYSYKYFIQTYHLEFLTALFWLLVAGGLLAAFVKKEKARKLLSKLRHKHIKSGTCL